MALRFTNLASGGSIDGRATSVRFRRVTSHASLVAAAPSERRPWLFCERPLPEEDRTLPYFEYPSGQRRGR